MKLTTTKTTKTTAVITHKATLTDDDGKTIAIMTGTIDAARPFGSANLMVQNRTLFNQHKDAAKAQYEAFQAALAAETLPEEETTDTTETDITEG